ncbi:regulatory protein [Streptomyces sp. RSD-27]|nr:regulatory protein [Streptomyces sp. RSD-27]
MADHTVRDGSILSGWRKASYSGNESGSCLEVLDGHPSAVPVRDSKNPHGPALLIPAPAWVSFVDALKRGPGVAP